MIPGSSCKFEFTKLTIQTCKMNFGSISASPRVRDFPICLSLAWKVLSWLRVLPCPGPSVRGVPDALRSLTDILLVDVLKNKMMRRFEKLVNDLEKGGGWGVELLPFSSAVKCHTVNCTNLFSMRYTFSKLIFSAYWISAA